MSNTPNEQTPSAAEQITQANEKLKQVREIVEGPEFSQEIYNRADNLTTEIRGLFLVIGQSDSREAHRILRESNRLHTMANKRLTRHRVE